jgi:two-component system sensor histidine kinase PrrB
LATIDVRGQPWRTLTVAQRESALEVGESLAPAFARADATRRLVIALSVAGLLATALVVWLLTGLALAPVQRLRRTAAQISTASDLTARLSAARDPAEVESLANTLNGMLARLAASHQRTEHALTATRRFAADAGHEIRTPLTSAQANLDILRRGHGLSEATRRTLLEEVSLEHARLVELLDALQALARGDAAGATPRELADVAEILDGVVFSARRRDPLLRLHVIACPDHAWVAGWPEGIRVMIDNLLRNAAVHAGPRAEVELSLHAGDGHLKLAVADDGPGVPAVERTRIFERFERGTSTRGPGSGLGLAIVAQQADLHGGQVSVRESEQGGALFEVTLPAAAPPDSAIEGHSRTAPVSPGSVRPACEPTRFGS